MMLTYSEKVCLNELEKRLWGLSIDLYKINNPDHFNHFRNLKEIESEVCFMVDRMRTLLSNVSEE